MKNQYMCPHCRGHLRIGDSIVFRIQNKKKEKGLLLLHPEVGNYSSVKHPGFHFKEGEPLDFHCPICQESLDAKLDKNLVRVIMIDKSHAEHEIYFSRIAGEKSTYQVSGDKVQATGEHSHRYTIFKMPEELIKYL